MSHVNWEMIRDVIIHANCTNIMLNMLYMQVIEMLVIKFGKIFPQYLFNHFSATTTYREFPG